MKRLQLFREITATYLRHGWQLRRVLMSAETLVELREAGGAGEAGARFEGVAVQESAVDALWFARASQGGREAWELRLAAETPYALFELFEADEAEEEREDVRREMEAQLRDYLAPQG
ncbi:MAG TPA: hypothetical protein VNA19_16330 [Pyrinomonadaceae bacterium]|jgi:hypothetical protein|nr:hypothetical protein [Pyrinomonadaceae bacterium]